MLWTDALESQFDRHARERGQDYEALGRVSLVRAGADGAEADRPGHAALPRLRHARATGCHPVLHLPAVRDDALQARVGDARRPGPGRETGAGRSGSHGSLAPAAGRASRPSAGPARRSRVGELRSLASETGTSWPAGREVVYEIDLPATLEGRGLVVGLFHRRRRKDGTWSRPQPLKAGRRMIDALPDPADREALSLLLGGHNIDTYYSYDPYETTGSDPLPPPGSAGAAGASRAVRRRAAASSVARQREEPQPLAWDDGGAWRFEMRVKAEGDRYVARRCPAPRRRRATPRPPPPSSPRAASCSWTAGRRPSTTAARSRGWPTSVATGGSRSRRPRARGCGRRCSRRARRPPVELPEELRIEEIRLAPCPRLRITARERGIRAASATSWPSRPSSTATRSCRPRRLVGRSPPGAPPRVYVRDAEAEQCAAGARCGRSGIKRPVSQGQRDGPSCLSPAPPRPRSCRRSRARAGTSRPRGGVYRRPRQRRACASRSGIDWFDLEATVDFEGQRRRRCRALLAGAAPRRAHRRARRRLARRAARGVARAPSRRSRASARREGEPPALPPQPGGRCSTRCSPRSREVEADEALRQGARSAAALRRESSPLDAAARVQRAAARLPARGARLAALPPRLRLRRLPRRRHGPRQDRAGAGAARGAARGAGERRPVARRRAALARLQLEGGGGALRARACACSTTPALDRRARGGAAFGDCDVVLTTYGTLRRDAALLQDVALRLRHPRRGAGDQERDAPSRRRRRGCCGPTIAWR